MYLPDGSPVTDVAGEAMPDLPIREAVALAEAMVTEAALLGIPMHVFQKWTCTRCGQRCFTETPDVFHTRVIHNEPDCGARIDPLELCGFALVAVMVPDAEPIPAMSNPVHRA